MSRPVTLFTGQWADVPLEDMCRKASDFGYQGIELACWGDHFEVNKAVADPNYCSGKRDLLDRYDLQCHAMTSGTRRSCRRTCGVTVTRRASTDALPRR